MTAHAVMAVTTREAFGILDRMLEVVDNDMLAHEGYISRRIVRPDLAEQGAVCRGHNACAIGSFFLAAGVKPKQIGMGRDSWRYMPEAINPELREEYMADYPAMALAYRALNNAATEYVETHDLQLDLEAWGTDNELEALFETYIGTGDDEVDGYLIEPSELRPVIVRAQELIHGQAT